VRCNTVANKTAVSDIGISAAVERGRMKTKTGRWTDRNGQTDGNGLKRAVNEHRIMATAAAAADLHHQLASTLQLKALSLSAARWWRRVILICVISTVNIQYNNFRMFYEFFFGF